MNILDFGIILVTVISLGKLIHFIADKDRNQVGHINDPEAYTKQS